MLSFVKNNCRFCAKVFCCKECREKHELKVHDVYPDCEICAYGKTILRAPTDDLLNHIKDKHWPLHCIDCNRIFGAVHELIAHNKCPLAKPDGKITNTPLRPNVIVEKEENMVNYESPPIMPIFRNTNTTPCGNELLLTIPKSIHLTTSTPRTHNDESLNIFGVITPSDTEIKPENHTEDVTDTTVDDTKSQQSKKRVTFNETPIYDSCKKSFQEKKLIKSSLKKSLPTRALEKSGYDEHEEEKDFQKQLETPKSCATVWETASTETPENKSYQSTYDSCESELEAIEDISESNIAVLGEIQKILKKPQSINIWTSMTCLVKSIVTGLSGSSVSFDASDDRMDNLSTPQRSLKRPRTDDVSEEFMRWKKMKITEIQCRKPINSTMPYRFYVRRQKPKNCDKATQTD